MQVKQYRWNQHSGWNISADNPCVQAQLILLFGGIEAMQVSCCEELQRFHPTAQIFGCTTAGEIFQTQVLEEALVATAIQFEQTQVKGFEIHLSPEENSFAVGDRLGRQIPPQHLVHVFVLSDGLRVNGSELVRGLSQHLPLGVTITGGLAGDGDRFQQTQVMWNGRLQSGKVVAVGLYGDRLKVGYGSFGGWEPFGPKRQITKSDGNVLYELDGEPALTLYKRYLGDHAANLPASGLLFPLSLQVESDDRYLVRTILAVHEAEQSLTFAGDVPEGTTAQLMKASFDRLVDGAMQAASISLQPLAGTAPELAILISCVGRKLLLNQRIEEEVEGVQVVLGDRTPLTGFYSYGEISPFAPGASCELHNQTMTITTLVEV
jgi:hypothetical protein